MKTLSLCLIVRDEEKKLSSCLQNAHNYADEIIIVDTGSCDLTKEIATKYTDKVFDFVWCDDFSKARNFSFDKASCDYIMWLDGDDLIFEDSINEIISWKNSKEKCDFLMCKYITEFDKNYNPLFEFYRERIIINNKKYRWKDRVHEAIAPSGKIIKNNKIKIYHNKIKQHTERNLNIYNDMIKKGETFSPRNQFYYARELYFGGMISQSIHQFSKFLADDKGWVENKIDACLILARCYQIQKDYSKALTTLFGSFMFGLPRGEIMFEIGNTFFLLKQIDFAIYWYKQALGGKDSCEEGAFCENLSTSLLPALQLCICYCQKGQIEEAYKYHLISKEISPEDERVQNNELYFHQVFEKNDK